MRCWRILASGWMLIALWGCSEPVSEFPGEVLASAETRQRGREVYLEHCALCHGETGDGRGERRHGFTTQPADFTDRVWRDGTDPDAIYQVIREGKPGTAMPSWKALPDRDLRDATVYVWSLGE